MWKKLKRKKNYLAKIFFSCSITAIFIASSFCSSDSFNFLFTFSSILKNKHSNEKKIKKKFEKKTIETKEYQESLEKMKSKFSFF